MSTIFNEIEALGYCVNYGGAPESMLEVSAHTVMALHVLVETGLLMTAGVHIIERSSRIREGTPEAPSRRYAAGSREDLAEAKAARHYAAARDALYRLSREHPTIAEACAVSMVEDCRDLVIAMQVRIASEATKH